MYVSSQAWESSEFLHFQRFGHQPFEGEKKISVEDFFFSPLKHFACVLKQDIYGNGLIDDVA